MLIVTRRLYEGILIYDEKLQIIKIVRLPPLNQYPLSHRIGIEAPDSYRVVREELFNPDDPFNKAANDEIIKT